MPISVMVNNDDYILIHCEGEVCLDDFIKANDYIYSELSENLAKFQIVDLVAATSTDMSAEDLHKISRQDANAVEKLKSVFIAVVAPVDLAFGLSRIWAAYADTSGVTTSVFRQLDMAQDWIMSMKKSCPNKASSDDSKSGTAD